MSAKFAKDLKAKGKKQYTETLNDLNEDAQADRDELVRNLTDLLEEYKLLDPNHLLEVPDNQVPVFDGPISGITIGNAGDLYLETHR